MMKSLFSFLLTILLITGIGGCYNCNNYEYYIDIQAMRITAIHAGWHGIVEEQKPVAFDSVIFEVAFSGPTYTHNYGENSFNFLPSAIASEDCDDISKGSKETFANITVITLTDFDNEFEAYDTINSIIKASKYFSAGYLDNEFKDLSQYIAEIQPGIFADMYSSGGLYLKLKRKTTQKIIKLRVDVRFTNGEQYSDTTIPITIKQ